MAIAKSQVPYQLEASSFLKELEKEHLAWLAPFDPRYQGNFNKLRNGDYEAAMTEAAVRRMLVSWGVHVEPAEELDFGRSGLDYLCEKNGYRFYVEVTHVSIQKAADATKLHPIETKAQFGSLNDALWAACRAKAAQCGGRAYPTLVAVGTYHWWATVRCITEFQLGELLTGKSVITWGVNPATGSSDGETHLSTKLYSAAFLQPDPTHGLRFARSSISGLLVCGGFDVKPTVLGVLHPNPELTFDKSVLPDVCFGELDIDLETGQMSARWNGTSANGDERED